LAVVAGTETRAEAMLARLSERVGDDEAKRGLSGIVRGEFAVSEKA
jgi:hypothetical protein